MTNKKVLITGGGGYVGSTAVRYLLELGYKVYVLDNLIHGADGVSCFLGHTGYNFVKGDIRDKKTVDEVVKEVDYVVHLAAIVGDAACKKNPDETRSINIDGTKNILHSSLKNNIKRFLFFSTCSSYGLQDENLMVKEDAPLNPVSLYAETKISMEDYIKGSSDNKIPYVILRPSSVHGPSPRMRFDLTVNHFVKDAVLDKKLEIYGGNLWRPLMWVGEVGRVIDKILSADLKLIKNQIFNLGTTDGNKRKIDIAEIIKKKYIPELEIKRLGKDEDLRSYRVDFSKIEKTIDFKSEKNLESAIGELVFSVKNNLFGDTNRKQFKNH